MNHAILIIDDDTMVATSLELLLKRAGYRAFSVNYPDDALPAVEKHKPALVLLDMNFSIDTSGRDGMGLLRKLLSAYPRLPIIQMTGWATVQLAVEGMKAGARDFIAKPWDNRELLNAVSIQIDKLPPGFGHGGAAYGVGVHAERSRGTGAFHKLPGGQVIGLFCVYLFLAVIGAFCELTSSCW